MELYELPVDHPRAVLDALIAVRGDDYSALSRLIGRNPTYIQQFIKRGSPKKLNETDRATLARYFDVDEASLGGRTGDMGPLSRHIAVPRLSVGASAGAGALSGEERYVGSIAFDPDWLRRTGLDPARLSIVAVEGDSMLPTLADGDEIMVDTGDTGDRLRDGIYVVRIDDALKVKRLARAPGKGRVSVISDNAAYPRHDDVALNAIAIVGRVVWTGRRLG